MSMIRLQTSAGRNRNQVLETFELARSLGRVSCLSISSSCGYCGQRSLGQPASMRNSIDTTVWLGQKRVTAYPKPKNKLSGPTGQLVYAFELMLLSATSELLSTNQKYRMLSDFEVMACFRIRHHCLQDYSFIITDRDLLSDCFHVGNPRCL